MPNKKILVVEDDEMNMELVAAVLKLGKYQMLEAGDAETGIQIANNHQPDLILIDIQLPCMDGLSATRIIKEDPKLKEIPVVALSAYAMQEDKDRAREAGCIGYITKPIDVKGFLATIAGHLT